MRLSELIEQKRKEKVRQANRKKAKTLAVGVAAGGAIGALSGLLFAPKSGKETRDGIKNTANDVSVKVKDKAIQTTDATKANITEAKAKIKNYIDSKKATEVLNNVEETPAEEIIVEETPVEKTVITEE